MSTGFQDILRRLLDAVFRTNRNLANYGNIIVLDLATVDAPGVIISPRLNIVSKY